jgi:hypothetical protein
MTARRVAALSLLAAVLAGCESGGLFPPIKPTPTPDGIAPANRSEAIDRVNDNLGRIKDPAQYNGFLSFSFKDEDGKVHRIISQESVVIYKPPRMLIADVRSPVGTVAQIGSNDDRFWLWIDPELKTLWWGSWNNAGLARSRKLPVPPNELLDALLLRPLPETLEGGLLPVLRTVGDDHRLVYTRLGRDRQPSGYREVVLSPKPPYQPVEIVDRLADGEVVMRARLSGYQEFDDTGAETPRHYVVEWPSRDAELRLDVLRARRRGDLQDEQFEFPERWTGKIVNIDAQSPPREAPKQ